MDYKSSNKSLMFQMIIKSCSKCRFKTNFFKWCDKCKLKHFELNYGKSPSRNNEIDKILKDNYCESNSSKELIEWIPYSEFKFINFANQELSKLYGAIWPNGYIIDWNKVKVCWSRNMKVTRVTLINFEDLKDLLYHIIIFKKELRFYGITKNPISLNFILVFDYLGHNQNIVFKCQILHYFFNWCNKCKLKHFKLNYGESPSENNKIDKILKDNYCESNSSKDLIEWIPYDEFKDVTHIELDENEEIYRAVWSEGCICDWGEDKSNWSREIKNLKVILINSEDSICLEVKLRAKKYGCRRYGITKNSVSLKYMLVFDYNLCQRCQFLNFFDWCKGCKLNHFQLNYGESPSGNNNIDNLLKKHYCESKSSKEFIEWIPYNELEFITGNIGMFGYGIGYAEWTNGYNWDRDKLNLDRQITSVELVNIKYDLTLDDDFIKELITKENFKIYGISRHPVIFNCILVCNSIAHILCERCQNRKFKRWCKKCKLDCFNLVYGVFPSGNNDIDNFLKENYCENNLSKELIEWIPYNEFKDITCNGIEKESSKYYTARYIDADITVILMKFESIKDLLNYGNKEEFPEPLESYTIYGISKDPISLNYLLIFEYSPDFLRFLNEPKHYQVIGISKDERYKYKLVTYNLYSNLLCSDCQSKRSTFFKWCDKCKITHFNCNYSKLPTVNNDINFILKDNYCKSNKISEFIEWIPYDSFVDITYINQGGFSKVYSALWLNSHIYEWDLIKLEWKRLSGYKNVALKVLESSCYNISGFLQEVQSYYKIGFSHKITKLYGISKDPYTQNYILVLEYVNHGSLRSFLDKYNKYLITTYKIQILKNIAEGLEEIHSKSMIHQDIHSENILTKDFDRVKITDLGLSKFINQQVNDNEKEKKIYGILPYIAPEVLQGHRYTQKADIYAFGIIINEVFTGERPFENYTNEIGLRIDICKNGLRPEIRKNTPKSLVNLLNKCWDATSSNRPTADEIIQKLNHFETDDIIFEELRNCNNEILRQYVESTNKLDYQKPFYNSKFHLTDPTDCCISNENEESTSRNNYQVICSSNELVIDNNSECHDCIIKSNFSDDSTSCKEK
ncbi:hypothetical protein RclHR1_09150013 [Rhizophagus clarus]|uniref:Kinase-like domain-containing protein n=1 Tax=Rhizophagus clarus TaxID=94130 RepID=A0A2Z6SHS6_9GLOM|nr:hypothetical protein RclHR1_09150013 [Rhizophagus clarus]GES86392.1 kinase-like domain-containing protein [Rhizophagus clarus]